MRKILKFSLLILFFSITISVKAYSPVSLQGKYTIITLNTLWAAYWHNGKICDLWGGYRGLGLISCPSAMVDISGILWIASYQMFQSKKGLGYCIARFEDENGTIVSQSHFFYPWTCIPGVTPQCLRDPTFDPTVPNDETYFKNYIHNILQPCIAHEVGHSDWVFMFIYCPPTRYMNAICSNPNTENGSVEGLMYFDFNKNAIKNGDYKSSTRPYDGNSFYYHTQNRIYSLNQQHLRKRSNMTHVNLETGNYTAWSEGSCIHLNFLASHKSEGSVHAVYHQFNSDRYLGGTLSTRSFWSVSSSVKTYPRYINFNNKVYGMIAYSYSLGIHITQQGTYNSDYTTIQNWAYPFRSATHNEEEYTANNYDFCIVKAKDGTGIICVLGLRPTCASSTDKTELSAAYNKAWNNTYTNWSSSSIFDPICLMLSSCRIDQSPSYIVQKYVVNVKVKNYPELCYESPQNIIYSTGKTSFAQACNLFCTCRTEDYEYHDTQLYKNTHKCCVYTAPSGNQYIIYAYCYPGKTKKCYLGYARCLVDSNYKVQLLSKTEFSQATWGDSIDEMNHCERIVSLDCKGNEGDEHVWLTWTYHGEGSASSYYIFHIKAKDLVGE